MSATLAILLCLALPAALSWPLGRYLTNAMQPATPGRGLDLLFHAVAGPLARESQSWTRYLLAMGVFNVVMFVLTAAVLATQQWLPWNPDGKGALTWDLIFNTTSSFVTNTNLQHYSGEVSMTHFSQIFALMWLQFVSAGTGLACLAAMSRALAGAQHVGNFFVDLQRATFLVLLPLSLVLAGLYVLGGMPMTPGGAVEARTLEGALQTIARGPVAAFVAIKQLGTNGGGFFGPNSTHPLENPGQLTNVASMIAIIILPMACVWMFGRLTGRMRHAAVIFAAMLILIGGKLAWSLWAESAPTPAFSGLAISQSVGNLEGKELRLGAATGPLWAVLTTCTSNGSVGAMHDSLNPLTGLAPLVGMWLNETFGGIGVGMINMFIYIIVAVFLAGMMIGRTPEYMGKRVEAKEMILASVTLLAHPLLILGGTAIFAVTSWGLSTIANTGPHGFSEILYEFSSAAANNGSGFEGLGDNTVPWNVATGFVMLLARYIPIVLPLAIAGSLARKRIVAETAGTLPVDTPTFGLMLLGVIVLLGALTFLPAAVLGPVADHLVAIQTFLPQQ
jgi:potassium-transporting ATPase potassium-binding subunit